MSLRRFNPFASNASSNSRRSSTRSARPPTYTSNTTAAAPAYTPSVNDRSVATWSASLPSASSIAFLDSDSSVFDQVESAPTDTVNIKRTPADITRPIGPRYIYYRVYAEDGAIPSANHVYSDDPYLGRILAELVSPPHTAISLKHCLFSVENIDDKATASLFVAASSQTPMDDAGRLSILAYPGPGCTPNEPMAFVVKLSDSCRGPLDEKKPEAVLLPSQEGPTPFETRYLYYRVYKQHGAVLSKQPADPNKPSVGRVSVDFVPPPHTAQSLMRCISKIEELDNTNKSQLFIDIASEFPMGDRHVSIHSSDRPGSTPENPMAFVVEPVLAVPLAAPVVVPTQYQKFTKRMRVIKGQVSDYRNPSWLAITPGDILHTTNAPAQLQPWVRPNGSLFQGPGQYLAYKAVNAAGQLGFVYEDNVKAC